MNYSKKDIKNMLGLVMTEKLSKAKEAFTSAMRIKLLDAFEQEKVKIAGKIYGSSIMTSEDSDKKKRELNLLEDFLAESPLKLNPGRKTGTKWREFWYDEDGKISDTIVFYTPKTYKSNRPPPLAEIMEFKSTISQLKTKLQPGQVYQGKKYSRTDLIDVRTIVENTVSKEKFEWDVDRWVKFNPMTTNIPGKF